MAVPSAYLTTTKNTVGILAAIQKASVPETFTYEFLKQLGYASSSDRPTLSVLKAIGFLDSGGRPSARYREYKDPSRARAVLAAALRSAYKDLFAVDTEAHTRTSTELAGMFSRLSDKGASVTGKMATTFRALADLADFSNDGVPTDDGPPPGEKDEEMPPGDTPPDQARGGMLTLRHDIHIHLPLSTDVAVYDSIFKSLKANLT